jgi:hypothetical protein
MLAEFVIFDMNCGNPSAFDGANSSPDVGGVEPAVFSIGDERHIFRIGDASSVVHHLVHRDKSQVRQAQARRRCGVATDVDRRKPMTFDQLRADRIMGLVNCSKAFVKVMAQDEIRKEFSKPCRCDADGTPPASCRSHV